MNEQKAEGMCVKVEVKFEFLFNSQLSDFESLSQEARTFYWAIILGADN